MEPGCHGPRGHGGRSLRTWGRAPPFAKAVGAPGVGAGPALGGSHWVPSLFADTATTAAAAPQGRCQLRSQSRRRARRGERAAARPGRNPRPRTAAPPGAQARAVIGRAGPTVPPTPARRPLCCRPTRSVVSSGPASPTCSRPTEGGGRGDPRAARSPGWRGDVTGSGGWPGLARTALIVYPSSLLLSDFRVKCKFLQFPALYPLSHRKGVLSPPGWSLQLPEVPSMAFPKSASGASLLAPTLSSSQVKI